jgi:hypothetical protein
MKTCGSILPVLIQKVFHVQVVYLQLDLMAGHVLLALHIKGQQHASGLVVLAVQSNYLQLIQEGIFFQG